MKRATAYVVPVLHCVLLAVAAAGCSRGGTPSASAAEPAVAVCPKAWKADWQKLANRVNAPVYCPSWLPRPLGGNFASSPYNAQTVARDRSYLISYVWFDSSGPGGINEVHVILRGYPGNPKIPTCDDTITVEGKTAHRAVPCFSDPSGRKRFGRTVATVYTANQGADQWHVVYAWRRRGSLYSLSEHVVAPYTYKQVIANLDRMMRQLVLVAPQAQKA